MKCPRCNVELIWSNDFDGKDLGYDNGFISFYHCNCGVQIEVYIPEEDERDEF